MGSALEGKELKTYSKKDLPELDLIKPRLRISKDAFKILGVVQVPWTNDYEFLLKNEDGKTISFDILTGNRK